jgi:GH24 family phage-related lysozyme (muramidase)
MQFVRDSAPFIEGQQSLTINSDNLSTPQSLPSGFGTTVWPAALLRSLSESAAVASATRPTQPLSAAGLEFLKQWEGFRDRPGNDAEGHCTVGYGSVLHTGACDGRPIEQPYASGITPDTAAQLLAEQCAELRQFLDDSLTTTLNQNQSDALISFVHNVGGEAFRASTLLNVLNAGDAAAAAREMRKWTKAARNGGLVEVPELIKRREAEAQLFERPVAMAQSLSLPHPRAFGRASAHGSAQQSFTRTHSYSFHSPSLVTAQSNYSHQQNPAALIAGIEIADAVQIGLAAVAIVQTQVAASQGTFSLSYDKAQRLLMPEARSQMPGSQSSKQRYSQLLFHLGIGRLGTAKADVIIEWEGNPYGEIGTPIIRRNLSSSTEWSKSAANITITKVDRIPLPRTDPRTWPIVYTYEGTYDPLANGYFEFSGEFELNAFGGLKFNRHEVVSRSTADWALAGTPEGKVQRGADVVVPVPEIPEEQVAYLRTRLP